MNALTPEPLLDHDALEREIVARDREVANPYTKDPQVTAIHGARRFLGDRLMPHRGAAPHPRPGRRPADRGAAHDPHAQDARRAADRPRRPRPAAPTASRCPACTPPARSRASAAVAMHGYRALEGTFLGGCLFSGRVAGRAAAAALAT